MTAQLETSDRNTLKSLVRGAVHFPDDDGYDQARQVWNGMIDRRPAEIIDAAGVADVMATVGFARERGLPIAVRCGGHNVAGNAVGDGLLWNEYDHETQAFGLASPGGAISTTGVAGLTLGGGYGYLSRRYGMACDNLLSADLVTASGELVTASADTHSDLFWALRGGGGNFGVVTSFEFQLHPVREVLTGLIAFPFAMSKTVLRRYRELCMEASDDFAMMAGILPAPSGGNIVAVVASHLGTDEEGERAIRPIRELGSVLMDTVARIPYCEMQRQLDVTYPKGMRHYWKSAFLKTLTDDVIDLMTETMSSSPSPLDTVAIEPYGGAVARVANDATAFGHRAALFNFLILAISGDPAIDAGQAAWARDIWRKILPHSTGGSYVNYMSAGEDVHSAYQDARFERLAAIKAQCDPANLFRFNQNIPPAKG